LVSKKETQNAELIAVVTEHISKQLDAILTDFDSLEVKPKHKEVLMGLKEKHAPPEPEKPAPAPAPAPAKEAAPATVTPKEKLEKHGKTVDDLLKELETLKS
jgi:hypothetical protein